MHCLWCHTRMIPELKWENIFMMPAVSKFCSDCEQALVKINGNRCQHCSRLSDKTVCRDCRTWQKKDDPLRWNKSVYVYNEQMKEIVSRWKYRGDYVLGNALGQAFSGNMNKPAAGLPPDIITVPIPLSEERLLERGFNQAKQLADSLSVSCAEILERRHSEKQSKKTRKERLTAENPFFLTETVHKPVLLVDDIYTTGTTLRQAASLLKEKGCPEVYAYTLIRG